MTIPEYISTLPADRQELMTALHETIVANDPAVVFSIKPLMGKESIMYEQDKYMKYALASAKTHLSLHCLPMYMLPQLHAKYEPLFPDAKFQKGCINFADAAEMPLATVVALLTDCAQVNMPEVLEKRKKK